MSGAQILRRVSDSSNLDMRLLIQHALGCSLENYIQQQDRMLLDYEYQKILMFIKRRSNHEPIAYITGTKEFYGREFVVSPNVLIPRPDSETLIGAVLEDHKNKTDLISHSKILELGVGSGCLLITLLMEMKNTTGYGVEISQPSIDIASANAKNHNVEDRINFYNKNWGLFLQHCQQKFDIIISNPPYIKNDCILSKEIYKYEPHIALFGGMDGIKCYQEILCHISNVMHVKSVIYFEIGYDMANDIINMYTNSHFALLGTYYDIAGKIRCLKFGLSIK